MSQGLLVIKESPYTNNLINCSQQNFLLGVNMSISISLQDRVK